MEFRDEHDGLAANPRVVVNLVRDAHQFFKENRIDENYQMMALDLIRRYASQEGLPREPDPFFGAALYMVTRHPWSHPNPLTKIEFASKMRMKESSLEWYTNSISEKLGFMVLHDKNQLPFFVDPDGTIANVVSSVIKASVGEEVVRSIVTGSVVSPNALAERIVDRLCNVVNIVPSAFEQELQSLVQNKIDEESNRLLEQLRGQ
ncbi:MAG: hypothetical protein P1Q69_04290 [Candidatus Thorarchaeota archaeon]|nr:hypothetical protein [Candidatus Thorarchaeota archaeon]